MGNRALGSTRGHRGDVSAKKNCLVPVQLTQGIGPVPVVCLVLLDRNRVGQGL